MGIGGSGAHFQFSWNDGASFKFYDGVATAVVGEFWIAATLTADGSSSFYANNPWSPTATASALGGTISYGATSLLSLGNYSGINRNSNCDHEYGLIYNRVLSPAELAGISTDPWAIVLPPTTRRYVGVGSGGGGGPVALKLRRALSSRTGSRGVA